MMAKRCVPMKCERPSIHPSDLSYLLQLQSARKDSTFMYGATASRIGIYAVLRLTWSSVKDGYSDSWVWEFDERWLARMVPR